MADLLTSDAKPASPRCMSSAASRDELKFRSPCDRPCGAPPADSRGRILDALKRFGERVDARRGREGGVA
jgi:hypothetical protein